MSGILKKKKILITICGIICGIVLELILLLNKCYTMFFLVLLIGTLTYVVNKKVKRKIKKQVEIFQYTGEVRNIDCLVIGDMYKLPDELVKNKKIIQLAAPERSLVASYEILRHTHSILKDDGKAQVIIAVKNKNINKENFSLFDVPFFHYITIQLKHLCNLKKKENYPVLFAPIRTMVLLFNVKSKRYVERENVSAEITEFCLKRGYTVKFYCK